MINNNNNNKQQNKYKLCEKRDKTVNCIVNECSRLARKEYKVKHDWKGNVILLELCKKLKYDHYTKCYMHKPESVLENEMHKILSDLEIQIDYLISEYE